MTETNRQYDVFAIRDGENFTKKGNMAYWDDIDSEAEEYIRNLAALSEDPIDLDDDEIIEIGKEITDIAINVLKHYGARYPYVDENY